MNGRKSKRNKSQSKVSREWTLQGDSKERKGRKLKRKETLERKAGR